MHLKMAGIDYKHADVRTRACLSFSAQAVQDALLWIKKEHAVQEAVIVSTCNRTELWVYAQEDPAALLQRLKPDAPVQQMIRLEEHEAILHLHRLACGLESQIMGDEQIITQLREALESAAELEACGPVLKHLFKSAVSTGKEARTQTGVIRMHRSVVSSAVEIAKSALGTLRGKKALVIGNGTIGQLTVRALIEEGCDVTMTLRRHKKLSEQLPQGARFVDYGDRYLSLPQCDVVISCTSSPHFVIQRAELQQHLFRPVLLIDLALPSDIEPAVKTLPDCSVFSLDDLKSAALPQESIQAMDGIAKKGAQDYGKWLAVHECIPSVNLIKRHALSEITAIEGLNDDQRDRLAKKTNETFSRLLFGLKRQTDAETFKHACQALAAGVEARKETR